jgi:hypothetical protein
MAAVATCEPNGRTGPLWLSQIISSAPSGWPLVPAARLNRLTAYANDYRMWAA